MCFYVCASVRACRVGVRVDKVLRSRARDVRSDGLVMVELLLLLSSRPG